MSPYWIPDPSPAAREISPAGAKSSDSLGLPRWESAGHTPARFPFFPHFPKRARVRPESVARGPHNERCSVLWLRADLSEASGSKAQPGRRRRIVRCVEEEGAASEFEGR